MNILFGLKLQSRESLHRVSNFLHNEYSTPKALVSLINEVYDFLIDLGIFSSKQKEKAFSRLRLNNEYQLREFALQLIGAGLFQSAWASESEVLNYLTEYVA